MADESLSPARSNSQEEGKMGALTDFLGAGEVATALGGVVTALLDKLEHAVGWCANHDTPSRTAVNTYIEEIQNSDKDPLVKAALISNARKIVKEYCNQKNIVSIAIQSVKSDAKPENIDDDWLAQFMDKARLVSAEEFQLIWGKILANECNHPGCVPRALLEILPRMDRSDAEAFTALKSVSVELGDAISPVVVYNKLSYYEQWNITFDSIMNLQALGLVAANLGDFFEGYAVSSTMSTTANYYGKKIDLSPPNELPVGCAVYTKTGDALAKAIDATPIAGFMEEMCIPFWKKCNKMKPVFKSFEIKE